MHQPPGANGSVGPDYRSMLRITCATPITTAHPLGFYAKHGPNVEVVRTAGWAVIRDKTLDKEYDAANMPAPMPMAITMGAGSKPMAHSVSAIENIDGQGRVKRVPNRVQFDPLPWESFAIKWT